MASLDSVRSKVFRAQEHYNSFKAAAEAYFREKVGQFVVEVDSHAYYPTGIGNFYAPEVPPQVALIIGDCLQNLRSSLDYLVWELCLVSGVEPTTGHAFPI